MGRYFLLRRFFILQALWLSSLVCWGQQALAEEDPKVQQADVLYNVAVTSSINGDSGEALRLLQLAFALHPSAVIAQTIGSLLPETELSGKRYWYDKAVSLEPDDEESLLSLFFLNCQENRLHEALALIDTYSQKHPEHEKALYYRASVYREMKEYDKAVSLLNHLVSNTTDQEIEDKATNLLLSILLAQGSVENAAQLIVNLTKSEAKNPTVLFETASKLVYIGAYRQALDLLSKSPLIKESYPDLITLKATIHMTLGETDAGIKECKRILSLSQITPSEKFLRLQNVFRADPSKEGNGLLYLPLIRELAETYPIEEEIQDAFLGYLYKYQDKKTVDQLSRMAQLFPEREDVALQLAQEYSIKGDYMQVDSIVKAWIDKRPRSYKFYSIGGISLCTRGNIEHAISFMQKGVDNIPSGSEEQQLCEEDKKAIEGLYTALGEAYHAILQNEKAFESFEKALTYYDKDPLLLNNYAYYLALERRNLEKAEELVARAVSLLPMVANILDTYSFVLMLRGKYTLSEIYIRQAIDLEPQKASLYDRYAEILKAQEKYEQALEVLYKAEAITSCEERMQLIDEIKQMLL